MICYRSEARLAASWVLVGAWLFLGSPATSVASDAALEGRIDRIFRKWDRTDGPGCAVGVVRDGELIFAKGYGMADLEHDIPIESDTVFYIGSTSKQFVAACIVLLEEEGKLSLDDDVRRFVPELPDYGEPISIRQLIHHTSGIRDYLELWRLAGRDYLDHIPEQAVLDLICAQKRLNFAPGERHLYSNSCYFLLSIIVERASGESLREYADRMIFQPLGMTKTHFHDDPGHIIKDRAFGYGSADGGGFYSLMMRFALVGSGGLYSTVEDLARWDRNFYENVLGQGGPALIEMMLTKGRLDDGEEIGYAYALMHGEYKGVPTVHHGGALGGYRAQLLRFPEQRFSVAVLSNLAGFDPTSLAHRVADACIADELKAARKRAPRDLAGDESVAPNRGGTERSGAVRIDAATLESYTGSYEVHPGLVLQIRVQNGELYGIVPGKDPTPLVPSSATDFTSAEGTRLRFHAESEGRVERMTVTEKGQSATARRVDDTPRPDPKLEAIVGVYACDELGVLYRVAMEEGGLRLRVGHAPALELSRVAPHTYETSHGSTLRLDVAEDGAIRGFELDGGRVKGLTFRRD